MDFSKIKQIDFFKNYVFEELESTGSTNDNLKAWIKTGNKKEKLQVADYQTCGRGQYGRKWESQKKQCLLFSFTCSFYGSNYFPPSLTAGICLANALQTMHSKNKSESPFNLWLKWPNDVWYEKRKLAGILTEGFCDNSYFRCVIGIGVNITPAPTSLNAACVNDFLENATPEDVLYMFCRQWNEISSLNTDKQKELWEEFAKYSKKLDFTVKINDKEAFSGKPFGITNEGALIILDEFNNQKEIKAATLFPKNL